jgi:hypothetical protein
MYISTTAVKFAVASCLLYAPTADGRATKSSKTAGSGESVCELSSNQCSDVKTLTTHKSAIMEFTSHASAINELVKHTDAMKELSANVDAIKELTTHTDAIKELSTHIDALKELSAHKDAIIQSAVTLPPTSSPTRIGQTVPDYVMVFTPKNDKGQWACKDTNCTHQVACPPDPNAPLPLVYSQPCSFGAGFTCAYISGGYPSATRSCALSVCAKTCPQMCEQDPGCIASYYRLPGGFGADTECYIVHQNYDVSRKNGDKEILCGTSDVDDACVLGAMRLYVKQDKNNMQCVNWDIVA